MSRSMEKSHAHILIFVPNLVCFVSYLAFFFILNEKDALIISWYSLKNNSILIFFLVLCTYFPVWLPAWNIYIFVLFKDSLSHFCREAVRSSWNCHLNYLWSQMLFGFSCTNQQSPLSNTAFSVSELLQVRFPEITNIWLFLWSSMTLNSTHVPLIISGSWMVPYCDLKVAYLPG
jgi:hypothetical protein